MDQQVGKFRIVPIAGIIGCIPFLSLFREPVPSPYDIEFDLWCNSPVFKKLGDTRLINWMNNPVDQQINVFEQLPAMDILSGTFIKGCIGFHQMHMDIQRFPVSALTSGSAECPVAVKHLPVSAIHCIGTIFLDQVKNLFSIFNSTPVTRCKCIFTKGIDRKAMAVDNFLIDLYISFAVSYTHLTLPTKRIV